MSYEDCFSLLTEFQGFDVERGVVWKAAIARVEIVCLRMMLYRCGEGVVVRRERVWWRRTKFAGKAEVVEDGAQRILW